MLFCANNLLILYILYSKVFRENILLRCRHCCIVAIIRMYKLKIKNISITDRWCIRYYKLFFPPSLSPSSVRIKCLCYYTIFCTLELCVRTTCVIIFPTYNVREFTPIPDLSLLIFSWVKYFNLLCRGTWNLSWN